ncbi:MAG: hypothetical protein PHS82_16175 [Lachnospiraceae bacterium]|nr:hypothetical protein [Lachnospiraceae bacterium]
MKKIKNEGKKKMCKKKKRILSLVLSLLMVCTMMPMPVSAAEIAEPEVKEAVVAEDTVETPEQAEEEPAAETTNDLQQPAAAEDTVETPADAAQVITEFTALAQETKEQQLAIGAAEADIVLPDTLQAKAGEVETELTGITWVIDADNSAAANFDSSEEMDGAYYTYKPVIPEEYTLEEGVEVPEIVVLVEDSHVMPLAEGDWAYPSTAPTTTWTGSGTSADDPYVITTAQQLADLAYLVNNGTTYANTYFALDGNIDLNDQEWTPIGLYQEDEKPFSGVLDGQGNTISGLRITAKHFNGSGLFGYLSSETGSATVKNLDVECDISGDSGLTGGVAGVAILATIENCTVSGTMSTTATTSVASYVMIGGIVGYGIADVTSCTNNASVTGDMYAGGIFARCLSAEAASGPAFYCNIRNCVNNGNIQGTTYVGGITGQIFYPGRGYIYNCLNNGTVTGTTSVGGIIGQNVGYVYNSLNLGAVSGATNVGSVVGYNCYSVKDSYSITGMADQAIGSIQTQDAICSEAYNAESGLETSGELAWKLNQDNYTSSTGPAHSGVWSQGDTAPIFADGTNSAVYRAVFMPAEGETPVATFYLKAGAALTAPVAPGGTWPSTVPTVMPAKDVTYTVNASKKEPAQIDGVYQIATADELYWFAAKVNGTEADGTPNSSACAKLVNDITVNTGVLKEDGTLSENSASFREWTPIGNSQYSGTFDGAGYAIHGLYVNASTVGVGLVGYNYGTIQNVNVVDSYFKNTNNLTGSVCGYNNGTIENCTNSGSVNGVASAGGVCGSNGGSITNCVNSGSVSVSVSAFSLNFGGVCGYNSENASITNCINSGNVRSNGQNVVGGVCGINSSGSITNCINSGSVSGTADSQGGVSGANYKGTITNCINSGSVSGTADSQGGVSGVNYEGTITNCYYDKDNCTVGGITGADVAGSAEGKTTTEFASGAVTWLLNGSYSGENFTPGKTDGSQVWYQTLGTGGDTYPVLDGSHGTVYFDGTSYTNTKPIVIPTETKVQGHSLTLNGDIGVNFYATLEDAVKNSTTAYILLSCDGADTKVMISDAVGKGTEIVTVAGKDYSCYKFSCNVVAKQMAKPITAKLYSDDKDTNPIDLGSYAVKDYMEVSQGSQDEKLKTLVTKMLDYGAYAQNYFGYDTANLAAIPSDLTSVVIPDTYPTVLTETATDKIKYYGSSLVLESETTLRIYFNIIDGSIDASKLTTDNGRIVKKTDTLYYVEITNIQAGKLGTEQNVAVSYDGAVQFNLKESAFSYAQKMASKDSTSDTLKNLLKALYQYGTEADIYFASTNQ